MNKDKYIIKNCPATYGLYNEMCGKSTDEYFLNSCKDYTDCIMKQIVEFCKNKMDTEFNGGSMFAEEVLQLFDIQEVE